VQATPLTRSGEHTKFKAFNFDRRNGLRYTMPLCHFDSHNLWILKPTDLNCGRGIHVFRDLDSFHKLIKQYCIGREAPKKKEKEKAENDVVVVDEADKPAEEPVLQSGSPSKKPTFTNKVKFNTFIIQKYIEKPLLIHKRKFDIRVWVLLTQD
jgi:hypothetical protein